MAKYQGHENWNHWNVALWLHNEQPLYRLCQRCVRRAANRDEAAREITAQLHADGTMATPDGAPITRSSVRAALVGWES